MLVAVYVTITLYERFYLNKLRLIAQHPTILGWRCTLAFLLAETGRHPEAKRELESLAIHNFADFKNRESDAIALNLLATTCVHLNDTPRARILYQILSPAADSHTVIAYAVAYFGPVADRLGQLASILSDWDAALSHFHTAIHKCTELGAVPWLAHVQHNFARALFRRNAEGDTEKASDLLDQSLKIAESLQMKHLIAKIKSLRN